MKKEKLLLKTIGAFAFGFWLLGLLLFLPAQTFHYPRAWILLVALAIPMVIMGIGLYLKNPDLLIRRLVANEKEKPQQQVMTLSGLVLAASFILCGLDRRYGWSNMAFWLSMIALGKMLLGYGLFVLVMVQNQYASRTIKVEERQQVVTTGLYRWVRHPMYFASVVLFLSMPWVLGSYIGFIPMLLYPFTMVKRIKNEEALLARELAGYEAYRLKTKYRLIPFIW